MAESVPTRPAPEKAAEICRQYEPGEEARRLLRDDLSADAYAALLTREHLYADAVQFLAHRLPKREAVWWACLCVWKVLRPEPPAKEAVALEAAVHWVQDPSEANRRAAQKVGEAAGPGTPAGGVALAAFWSGGSMAPPGLPEVAPPTFLTARTLAGALRLAAVRVRPDAQDVPLRLFVDLGGAVADGKNRWEPPKGPANR
jgi:hypothetical protein